MENQNNESNSVNIAGENIAPQNNVAIDIDKIAETIIRSIEKKNEKNEKSIVQSNTTNLSEDDAKAVLALLKEKKELEEQKKREKEQEKDNEILRLKEVISSYENKERSSNFNNNINSVFEELGIVDEGCKKQALKLATAGADINCFFKEDGSFDTEKIKGTLNDILKDVPSLKSSEVVINLTNHNDDLELKEAEKQRKFARFGWSDEQLSNNNVQKATSPKTNGTHRTSLLESIEAMKR